MQLRHPIILTCLLFFALQAVGQNKYTYNDGPYVSYLDDKVEVLWLEEGKLKIDTVETGDNYAFKTKNLPPLDLNDLTIRPYESFEFNNVEKFTAISDIHGQYELFTQLLKVHGIIDDSLNWTYGKGHLVVVGDVLDRGPEVIEALWLIYHLENQALKAGGRVHMLLGNHEIMVINDNLGYVNKKYLYTSGISQRLYSDFFGQNSFFGKWLSSKPVALTVNNNLFVHGGFSPQIENLNIPLGKLNGIFQNKLLYKSTTEIEADSILNLLYFNNGPLWYRGYAFPSAFDKAKAKSLLKTFGKDRIIVGHTSMPEIKSLYGNRIILVDSSIKFGKQGEILQFENGKFSRAHSSGTILPLVSEEDKEGKLSIYSRIYEDDNATIRISTDIKTVYKSGEENYTDGLLYYYQDGFPYSFNIGIRTSGNMRRQICELPPLKVNFKKKELKAFGYTDSDKFKILMPCRASRKNTQQLLMEHLIYEIYDIIDSFGLQSKIATVLIEEENKNPEEYTSLLIEHKSHMAKRLDVIHVKEGILRTGALDREDYLKFCLFQFLIANPDWALVTRHNVIPIKKKHKKRISLVPYDFDYCGLIKTEYAVPHESLPISDVSERYFMDKTVTMNELKPVLNEFLKSKEAVIRHTENVEYLDKDYREKALKFLERSYRMLENDKRVRKYLGIKEK